MPNNTSIKIKILMFISLFPPSFSSLFTSSSNSSYNNLIQNPTQSTPLLPSFPPTFWDIVESKPIGIYPIKKHTIATFPNPQDNWDCNVDRLSGHLCDPDSLLEKEDRIELQELITFFPEWTKNPISTNRCVQKGVKIGIALSQFPIEVGQQQRPLFENITQRQWRDWIQDGDTRRLIDVIWQRLNELSEDPKNQIGARIARDWGLVEGTFGCHLGILIMINAVPMQIHIYSHSSIPISPFEKKAIIAEQRQFLRNPSKEYPRILRSILGALRELIVHKRSVLIGTTRTVPISRKSKLVEEQNCKEKANENVADSAYWHRHHLIQWFALSITIFFSFSSFLLAIFLFFRIRLIAKQGKSSPAVEKGSLNCRCHKKHGCCLTIMRMNTLEGGMKP